MRFTKKNIRQGFGILQLVFFCLIILNGILFIHSHRLDDGRIVIHAHPFMPQDDGTPIPHQHNAGELIILSQSFQANIILSEISLFDFSIYASLSEHMEAKSGPEKACRILSYHHRRGPPANGLVAS